MKNQESFNKQTLRPSGFPSQTDVKNALSKTLNFCLNKRFKKYLDLCIYLKKHYEYRYICGAQDGYSQMRYKGKFNISPQIKTGG